jgi:hypothetical protein
VWNIAFHSAERTPISLANHTGPFKVSVPAGCDLRFSSVDGDFHETSPVSPTDRGPSASGSFDPADFSAILSDGDDSVRGTELGQHAAGHY